MRWLKVSYFLSRAGAPVLLSATLVSGCGRTGKLQGTEPDSGPDLGVLVVLPAADGPVDLVVPSFPDLGTVIDPPADLCPCGEPIVFTIPFPTEGVAATPAALCAAGSVSAGMPITSGPAARVTMAWASNTDGKKTLGTIVIAPELVGKVVGVPTVAFVPTASWATAHVAISNLHAAGQGFAFDAVWRVAPTFDCHWQEGWMFKTSMQIQCDGGVVRAVESLTTLRLCSDGTGVQKAWIGSGDTCDTCAVICEMAPSPIVPAQAGDDLPLASALTVAIRALTKVGSALVLLAEHDGGADGFSYTWRVSAGHVEVLERDVVLWRLPDGESDRVHLAQVAVVGAHAAAVASLRRGPCLA